MIFDNDFFGRLTSIYVELYNSLNEDEKNIVDSVKNSKDKEAIEEFKNVIRRNHKLIEDLYDKYDLEYGGIRDIIIMGYADIESKEMKIVSNSFFDAAERKDAFDKMMNNLDEADAEV